MSKPHYRLRVRAVDGRLMWRICRVSRNGMRACTGWWERSSDAILKAPYLI